MPEVSGIRWAAPQGQTRPDSPVFVDDVRVAVGGEVLAVAAIEVEGGRELEALVDFDHLW